MKTDNGLEYAIKSCPFCGDTAVLWQVEIEKRSGVKRGWKCGCRNAACLVKPQVMAQDKTQAQAICIWNRRKS